jgi:hypothetical protein
MINRRNRASQKGVATMFVTMVLLILITLMVVTAFSLSTLNLKTVGNLQARKEAIAAGEKAIEIRLEDDFWAPVETRNYDVDIDNDAVPDYQVTVTAAECLRFEQARIKTASSVTLPGFSAVDAWNTIWELDALATNNVSGTRVRVRQGVRILMTEADKDLYCNV